MDDVEQTRNAVSNYCEQLPDESKNTSRRVLRLRNLALSADSVAILQTEIAALDYSSRPVGLMLGQVTVPECHRSALEQSLDSYVWITIRKMHISGNPWGTPSSYCDLYMTPLLEIFLPELISLKSVKISRMHIDGEPAGKLLDSLSGRLDSLDISSCSLDHSFVQAFVSSTFGSKAPRLLRLHDCGLEADTMAALARNQWEENTIECLDLSNNQTLEVSSLPSLATLLEQHALSLADLTLSATAGLFGCLTHQQIQSFVTAFNKIKYLRSLDISHCRIPIYVIEEMLPALSNCHDFRIAGGVSFEKLPSPPTALLDWIGSNNSLQLLDLGYCHVGNDIIMPLFEAIKRSGTLQTVRLWHNEFDVCGWEENLPHLPPSLTELKLSLYSLDDGLQRFQRALEQNTNLLEVSGTNWDHNIRSITRRNKGIALVRLALSIGLACPAYVSLWPHILCCLSSLPLNTSPAYLFLKEIHHM